MRRIRDIVSPTVPTRLMFLLLTFSQPAIDPSADVPTAERYPSRQAFGARLDCYPPVSLCRVWERETSYMEKAQCRAGSASVLQEGHAESGSSVLALLT